MLPINIPRIRKRIFFYWKDPESVPSFSKSESDICPMRNQRINTCSCRCDHSDRKDWGGTVGKPFALCSIFSTTGTVHLTALMAVQFSGGQISLTSCLAKLVPQLGPSTEAPWCVPSPHENTSERSGNCLQLEEALEMRFSLLKIKGLPPPSR